MEVAASAKNVRYSITNTLGIKNITRKREAGCFFHPGQAPCWRGFSKTENEHCETSRRGERWKLCPRHWRHRHHQCRHPRNRHHQPRHPRHRRRRHRRRHLRPHRRLHLHRPHRHLCHRRPHHQFPSHRRHPRRRRRRRRPLCTQCMCDSIEGPPQAKRKGPPQAKRRRKKGGSGGSPPGTEGLATNSRLNHPVNTS